MKKLTLISIIAFLAAFSLQIEAQQIPKTDHRVKVKPKPFKPAVIKFKTGKALVPIQGSKAKTPFGKTEIFLNTGDPTPPKTPPKEMSKKNTSDNSYNCITTVYNIESMPVSLFNPLDKVIFENVYPGQILDANDFLKSQPLDNYTLPSKYIKKSYQLIIEGFNKLSGKPLSIPFVKADNDNYPDKLGIGDYKVAHNNFMAELGSTLPTVNSFVEHKEIYSLQQLETEMGVTVSANISSEAMALLTGIPIGIDANVDINNRTVSSQKKSRILTRIITEFYTVTASPEDGYNTFLSPEAAADLPHTLGYVKSVTYGTVRYIMFESTGSMEELKQSINVGLGADVGIDLGGVEVEGGSLEVEVKNEFLQKIANNEIRITAFGIGLNGEKSQSLITANDIQEWFMRFDPFGNGNAGKPIRFVINYLKDNAIASVSYIGNIAETSCTPKPTATLKYDVKLKLAKIEAVKVDEGWGGDDTEDLFGRIYLSKSVVGNSKLESKFTHQPNPNKPGYPGEWDYAHTFFHYKESSPFQIAKGKVPVNDPNGEKIIATNQSHDAVKKMQVAIGYTLKDKEINTPKYVCEECDTDDNRVPTPIGEVQLSSINAATPNEWTPLKFGTDNFFEMNFFEEGKDREGSHIRAWFQILVKAK